VQDPDRIGDITLLQMTGLDLYKVTNTGISPGPDDLVDDEYISYENGLLHFPDLRPFDPDPSDLGLDPARCLGFLYRRFDPGGPGDPNRMKRPRALPDSSDYARPRSTIRSPARIPRPTAATTSR